jgi:hypothetical protein
MAKVMVSFSDPNGPPTLAALAKRHGLKTADFDAEFGVVEVDPQAKQFTVLVEESVAAKLQPAFARGELKGPFGNPQIEPFGPPSSDRK